MTTRDTVPVGAPCWADLWTSDVEGSRRFYAELFGWEAQSPSPESEGYFMFTRHGEPVAGGMGDMGAMRANIRGARMCESSAEDRPDVWAPDVWGAHCAVEVHDRLTARTR